MTPKLVRVFAFFQPYCKTDARCRRNSKNFRKLASGLPQCRHDGAPQRNDARCAAYHCAVVAPRSPIPGIVGCCARAASGHAAASPTSVMNARRLPRNSIQKIPVESMTAVSSMRVRAARGNSFDHLVGAGEQSRRNVDSQRPCSFEVDEEVKFRRQYHGQLRWFLALHDPADVVAGLTIGVASSGAVAHEAAGFRLLAIGE